MQKTKNHDAMVKEIAIALFNEFRKHPGIVESHNHYMIEALLQDKDFLRRLKKALAEI